MIRGSTAFHAWTKQGEGATFKANNKAPTTDPTDVRCRGRCDEQQSFKPNK
jgi:hypothetical protein